MISFSGLPAHIRPISDFTAADIHVTDNGADDSTPGGLIITAAGAMSIGRNSGGANFTSTSTTVGFYGWTVTYLFA